MKTLAMIVLSLFLAKSCNEKKETAATQPINSETSTISTVTGEDAVLTPNSEVKQETEASNAQENATKVEYEAMSRGFYKKIVFENNQVVVMSSSEDKGKIIKLSKEEMSELTKLTNAVDLETLPTLKAPTDKRTYDGAAHANLIITIKGKTYAGAGFDAGVPPKAIEKIVNKLVSYSEEK